MRNLQLRIAICLPLVCAACSLCEYDDYSGPEDTEYSITCLNGASNCSCINSPSGEWAGDDEAGEPECGTPVFADGRIILSHNSCHPLVEQALAITGDVPFAYDYPHCNQPQKKHRCFTELELIDDGNPDNDLWCAFCPEITGIEPGGPPGDDFSICWDNAEDWDPATLDGAIPSSWDDDGWPNCESIVPPIGELVGYTLPMYCQEGASCLRLDGCSCNCRDGLGNSIGPAESDYIEWWWNTYPNDVPPPPPEDPYGLPVEATCTGEPLVWTTNGIGQQWALGKTLELDGYEPAYPPNGELHHTPAWDLLPSEPYRLTDVPEAYVATVAAYPSEVQHDGSRIEMQTDGAEVVACHRNSICDRLGFAIGDRLLGITYQDGGMLVQYVDARGPTEKRIGVTP